jgi:hypothetical protein
VSFVEMSMLHVLHTDRVVTEVNGTSRIYRLEQAIRTRYMVPGLALYDIYHDLGERDALINTVHRGGIALQPSHYIITRLRL